MKMNLLNRATNLSFRDSGGSKGNPAMELLHILGCEVWNWNLSKSPDLLGGFSDVSSDEGVKLKMLGYSTA